MREIKVNEMEQIGGAISCQLNPEPINWAAVGGAALVGAGRGGALGAFLGGAGAYLGQSWICRF